MKRLITLLAFLAFTCCHGDDEVKEILSRDKRSTRDCSDPENPQLTTTTVNTTDQLIKLRNSMSLKNYDAYIVPSDDSHFLATKLWAKFNGPREKKLTFISGFDGSGGVAVITQTDAVLWTYSSMVSDAHKTMDCNWEIMEIGKSGTLSMEEWVIGNLQSNQTVAAYPFVFSSGNWMSHEDVFTNKNLHFVSSEPDLIVEIWDNRPPSLGDSDKLSHARESMTAAKTDAMLLTVLEEIAWLFNLRGQDNPYTPIFVSYAILHKSDYVKLYANQSLFDEDVVKHLNTDDCETDKSCVEILPYESAPTDLKALSSNGETVWMAKDTTTYGMYKQVDITQQYQDDTTIKFQKTYRDEVQVKAIKEAHLNDSLSLCEFLMWLDKNVPDGTVDEIQAEKKVLEIRKANGKCLGESYRSISASGPNGAIITYRTTKETNRQLGNEMFMIDSGGQYMQGTTDVTRTVRFGEPTAFEIEVFTRLLMGVIDIEKAVWCSVYNRESNYLDILVRQHLYDIGLEYRHATGHGVGQYLSVLEYPPRIGGMYPGNYPLKPGILISIEPGYYQDGKFGIRHESYLEVKKVNKKYDYNDYDFYGFENIILVPFQRKMINATLMSDKQLSHLNQYHKRISDVIGEEAKRRNKMDVFDWISDATQPITRSSAKSSSSSILLMSLLLTLIYENMLA